MLTLDTDRRRGDGVWRGSAEDAISVRPCTQKFVEKTRLSREGRWSASSWLGSLGFIGKIWSTRPNNFPVNHGFGEKSLSCICSSIVFTHKSELVITHNCFYHSFISIYPYDVLVMFFHIAHYCFGICKFYELPNLPKWHRFFLCLQPAFLANM
jgi:hypothetical protein